MENNNKKENLSFYQSVKNWNWESIKNYVEHGYYDINDSLIEFGPRAGYTALHLAALENNDQNVIKLIQEYKVNVNSVGYDGATPLHLACAKHNHKVSKILLKFGGNPNLEFTEELYFKYGPIEKWSDDFGESITLVFYAVVTNDPTLLECLSQYKPKFVNKGSNKTWLMLAVESGNYYFISSVYSTIRNNFELLNARDDNGLHVLHYLLADDESKISGNNSGIIVRSLMKAGADIDATINGDPATQILNMAAYRNSYALLKSLLNIRHPFSIKSRPLFYATLSDKKGKFRNNCIKLIIEFITLRQKLGLFVPEDELQLMDNLAATNSIYQFFIDQFNKSLIAEFSEQISSSNKTMTAFEFMTEVLDDNNEDLLTDDQLVEAYQKFAFKQRIVSDQSAFMLMRFVDSKLAAALKKKNQSRGIL